MFSEWTETFGYVVMCVGYCGIRNINLPLLIRETMFSGWTETFGNMGRALRHKQYVRNKVFNGWTEIFGYTAVCVEY